MFARDEFTASVHREIAARAAHRLEWFERTENTLQIKASVACDAGIGVEGYDEAMAYLSTAAEPDTEAILRRARAMTR